MSDETYIDKKHEDEAVVSPQDAAAEVEETGMATTQEGDDGVDENAPAPDEPADAVEDVIETAVEDETVADAPTEDEPAAAVTEDDEAYGTMPGFLTRDEYEQVGDDPAPLPEGFEVIDGGANAEPIASTEVQPPLSPLAERQHATQEPARVDELKAAGKRIAHATAEAAGNVGTFITQGVGAVREMSAAKRAHSEAREMLDELDRRIKEQTEELLHRQDVTGRFEEIIAEQTTRKNSALSAIKASQALQKTIQERIDAMKAQLNEMKEQDAETEKQLKAALESAESKEESARDAANRMKRRLADSQRALEKARETTVERVEEAKRAVDTAEERLEKLRSEYAEIQRNPSANSAAYSVRDTELAADISDATETLRRAKDELPRVTADAQATLAASQAAVHEAEKPVADAKESFRAISDATADARDALDAARKDAATRQKQIKGKIAEQEKDLKEEQRSQAEAEQEVTAADQQIAAATDIHDHPEITERIAAACAADRAEREELLEQVDALAEAEANVRERTRGSRMRLIAVIAAVIVVIAVIVALWLALS